MKPQLVQSTHEEQPSGVQVGDLAISPLSGMTMLDRIHHLASDFCSSAIPVASVHESLPVVLVIASS